MAKRRKRPPGRYRAPYRDNGGRMLHTIKREESVPPNVLAERNTAMSAPHTRVETLLGDPRKGRSALERTSDVMALIRV